MKLHGEGAFNPGKPQPWPEGGVKWDDPPGLAARLEALVTGGGERWRGNYPAYVLNRWGGKLPAGGLKALIVAGGDCRRVFAWLAQIPTLAGIALVADPEDAGAEGIADELDGMSVRRTSWEDLGGNEKYHLIVADYVLSRQTRLENCLDRLGRALVPGGLLALRDYTGPDRFQFSDAQMGLANALLPLLPEARRLDASGRAVEIQEIPPLAWVINTDPRAAVNSQEVRAAVASGFAVVEEQDLGGTLLMPLLAGIAGRFVDASPECGALLDTLWKVERALIEAGLLPSDHWFAVVSTSPVRRTPTATEGVFINRESAW